MPANGKFTSRDKLFKHLRSECWKVGNSHVSETSGETSAETLDSGPERRLIESTGAPILGNGHTFRGSHYATALFKGTHDRKADKCYLNTGCPLSAGDKASVRDTLSSAEIRQLATPLPVRGI